MTQPPPGQFSGIFISYRREDSSGHAGRLYDHLVRHFGTDQVFMDIDRIEPGDDFVKIIEDAVGSCDVLLAVIGRDWLSAADGSARRLDNPNDFVRLEIAAALQRDILVIPVLVRGAFMPPPSELPDELSSLSRRHASEVSDRRWDSDVKRLIAAIEKARARREETRRRQERETQEQRRREDEARREEQEQARRSKEQAERLQRLQEEAVRDELRVVREKARRIKEAEERASPTPSLKTTQLWSGQPPGQTHEDASSVTSPGTQSLSRSAADTGEKKSGGKLFPIIIGGGLVGVPSGIPLVSTLCFIWAVGGGILAVKSYSKRANTQLTPGEGAKLGAWAGLFGSLLASAISLPISYYNYTVSPELSAQLQGSLIPILLGVEVMRAALLISFSTVGGLIGVKRQN